MKKPTKYHGKSAREVSCKVLIDWREGLAEQDVWRYCMRRQTVSSDRSRQTVSSDRSEHTSAWTRTFSLTARRVFTLDRLSFSMRPMLQVGAASR